MKLTVTFTIFLLALVVQSSYSSPVSDEMTEIKPIKEKLRIIETIASSTIKATDASTTQIASTSKVTSTTQIASTTQVLSASEEEEDIGDYVDPDPDDGISNACIASLCGIGK